MLQLSYDLHIHSCLSPCGDIHMTPANIAAMGSAKGLEVLALTDHNTARNCPPFQEHCRTLGLIGIAGMELTTIEEVHAVCLFRTLDAALDFDSYVYKHLQKIENNERIFGPQILMDSDDRETGREPYLLINATDISFDELWALVRERDGVMFPAHIDKSSNSLISNLGFIPPDAPFKSVEIKDLGRLHALKAAEPCLENFQIISNSDAHYLEAIHDASLSLLCEEKSVDGVIDALLRGAVKL